MDITLERLVAATPAQLWHALTDPETMRRLLPGCARLHATAARDFDVAFEPGAPAGLAGVAGQAHLLEGVEPERLRLGFEGHMPDGFVRGESSVVLVPSGDGTMLRATLGGHGGGAASGWSGPAGARAELERFLDRLVGEVGGTPAEPRGADGPTGLLAAATRPAAPPGPIAAMLAAIPAEPLGFPRVAWIGAALFGLIFLAIFGSYVF